MQLRTAKLMGCSCTDVVVFLAQLEQAAFSRMSSRQKGETFGLALLLQGEGGGGAWRALWVGGLREHAG